MSGYVSVTQGEKDVAHLPKISTTRTKMKFTNIQLLDFSGGYVSRHALPTPSVSHIDLNFKAANAAYI